MLEIIVHGERYHMITCETCKVNLKSIRALYRHLRIVHVNAVGFRVRVIDSETRN